MSILNYILDDHDELYTAEYLAPLKSYKYQAVDKSFVSRYILKHYWNWAFNFIPSWMAPNLVTLIGLSFMLFANILVLFYIPDLVSPAPKFIYFLFAGCMWLYSTFDNLDGKQARKTGTSSPLGELFDHGCDALNCGIGSIVQIAAMGLGTTDYALLTCSLGCWIFYLSTWEEFHTGVLYLGYVNGPTEGIIGLCVVMILSGIYGPQIWLNAMNDKESFLNVGYFAIAFFCIGGASMIVSSLLKVRKACIAQNKSFLIACSHLTQMIFCTLAAYFWLKSPFSQILNHPLRFILFILTTGIAFGKMATKIILAHLTKKPFPYFSGLVVPLFIGSFLVNTIPRLLTINAAWDQIELFYLWAYLVIAIIGYGNWVYHVVKGFCDFLNIGCLCLKNEKQSLSSTRSKTE